MPLQVEIDAHREEYRNCTDSQLIAKEHGFRANSPQHIAAKQLIAERRDKTDAARHTSTLATAQGANEIAKWAIVIALVALAGTAYQIFW